MSTVKLRILRPVLIAGHATPAGDVVTLHALEAADLLDVSGAAVLVDARDAEAVRQARQRATVAALRAEGRPWHGAQTAAPWQR